MRIKKGKTNLSQSPLRILGLVVIPATNPKCAGRRRGSLPSICVTSTRRVKAPASDNPRVVGMRARIEADKKFRTTWNVPSTNQRFDCWSLLS
ncbi:hypothetical protein DPMN_119401 [Dreissena polymorpha]|uniref:Uncharacterized protein n=1 Tax=Dreissena polymorpha TaxID=45954 RepID=A0A9D4GME7_DREPO|nr:hypothetical protein DPMN_119401 [Dreissena polymorpha]